MQRSKHIWKQVVQLPSHALCIMRWLCIDMPVGKHIFCTPCPSQNLYKGPGQPQPNPGPNALPHPAITSAIKQPIPFLWAPTSTLTLFQSALPSRKKKSCNGNLKKKRKEIPVELQMASFPGQHPHSNFRPMNKQTVSSGFLGGPAVEIFYLLWENGPTLGLSCWAHF